MCRSRILCAGVACCAWAVGGCNGPTRASEPATQPATQPAAGAVVSIDNFAFTPAMITVPVGTRVEWVNHDDVPHTVTSDGGHGLLKSQALDTDDRYSVTFEKPGEYPYYCAVHPHMRAKVMVINKE